MDVKVCQLKQKWGWMWAHTTEPAAALLKFNISGIGSFCHWGECNEQTSPLELNHGDGWLMCWNTESFEWDGVVYFKLKPTKIYHVKKWFQFSVLIMWLKSNDGSILMPFKRRCFVVTAWNAFLGWCSWVAAEIESEFCLWVPINGISSIKCGHGHCVHSYSSPK